MQIHDPVLFGAHVRELRMRAGLTLPLLVKMIVDKSRGDVELHPKLLDALERGMGGKAVDDDLIDALMDVLPGFSPSTAPGVNASGRPVREARDMPAGRDMLRGMGGETDSDGRPADAMVPVVPDMRSAHGAGSPRAPAQRTPAPAPAHVSPGPAPMATPGPWGGSQKSAGRPAGESAPERSRPGESTLSDWLKGR